MSDNAFGWGMFALGAVWGIAVIVLLNNLGVL